MSLTIFPLNDRKAPACESWQDYTGEANTPMVGVKVPDGVVIIDLDLYKGVTLEAVNAALGCEPDWESAALQSTLNGGMHYAFSCDTPDIRQGSDLLGLKGFDTRVAGKGYIATGKGYTDATDEDVVSMLSDPDFLPELPTEAVQALTASTEVVAVGDDEPCDLMDLVSAQPLGLSHDEMQAYIELLPDSAADDQDEWFRVGMGIWHETGGDESGWQLFDAFSRRCADKYDEQRNRRRWDSFGNRVSDNPVTFASVIKMAGGAEAKATIQVNSLKASMEQAETVESVNAELARMANMKLDNLTLEAMLKKVQSKFKALRGEAPSIPAIRKELKRLRGDENTGDYVDEYVFMTATGEYMHRDTKAVMGPRAFDVKHSRETPLNGDGDRQSACQYANDRIDVVENSMYFPKAGEMFSHEGLDYLNEYIPSRLKRVPAGTTDIVGRVKGHIAHLLPDEREQDLVINYLAHNVQHPGEKIQWAIVLQGVQGDGKSFIAEMMQHVMGFKNVRLMNVQTLESAFTGWATGQCMTFIEELKLDNKRKYEVLNNLKPYISNPTVEETKKGKDPRTVINTTNYFALTNFQDAIPIDENDRRYCILFSQWQSKARLAEFMDAHPDYYPELYEALRECAGEVLDWLSSHPIPKWFKSLKRAPDTNAKERMREMSKSPAMVELEDALERFGPIISEGDEIDITELGKQVKQLQALGEYEDFPKTSALKNALLTMGYQPSGRRRPESGDLSKHYFYKKI